MQASLTILLASPKVAQLDDPGRLSVRMAEVVECTACNAHCGKFFFYQRSAWLVQMRMPEINHVCEMLIDVLSVNILGLLVAVSGHESRPRTKT